MLVKKSVRAIKAYGMAYAACILLMSIGVMAFVAMNIGVDRLEQAKNRYYENNNLADIFVQAISIPTEAKDQLEQISGVKEVLLRLSSESRVLLPDNDKMITLRIVSFPDEDAAINKIDFIEFGAADQGIFLTEDFAAANGIKAGDEFPIVINGFRFELQCLGVAASPEYVYIIRDELDILPDPETFGIGFMPEDTLAALLNSPGVYNEACLLLEAGYSFEDMKDLLEDFFLPYGLKQMTPQKDQLSFAMLEGEIQQLQSMAGSIPLLFMAMAMLVTYLMLKRLIEQERMEIGALKAMGYSNSQIMKGYLVYGLAIGVVGGVVGIFLGMLTAEYMAVLFREFFKLPTIARTYAGKYTLTAFFLCLFFSLLGTMLGAARMINLRPAEAMRLPAPKQAANDFFKYFPWLKKCLSTVGFMAVRSIWRSKIRSSFIVVSVMFSFSLLSFMGSFDSMVDDMLLAQFTKIMRYDLKVSFRQPVSSAIGLQAVQNIQGVESAHTLMEMGVELSYQHRKTGAVITGIPQQGHLYAVYDSDKKAPLPLPHSGGIVLSHILADTLEAQKGDIIYVSSPYLYEKAPLLVEDIAIQYMGSSSYMEQDALLNLFQLPDVSSAVVLTATDSSYIKKYLLEGDNIAAIEDKQDVALRYNGFMGTYQGMIVTMEVLSAVIAFAMIYNTAAISLAERKREYATLRVLGMSKKEIAGIVSFEYWILSGAGMALGVPFTYLLKSLMDSVMAFEMFRLPTYTPPSAFLIGVVGCGGAVCMAGKIAEKRIGRFDLVEVLKERQ